MNFFADYTGFCLGDPGELCFQDGMIYCPHFFCCMPDSNGSRCVGTVAFIDTAKIYREEIPILYLPICRHRMGHTAVRAACNNRVEAHSLSSADQHQILQACRYFQFRHPGFQFIQQLRQSFVRNFLCSFHAANFIFVF